MGLDVWFKEDIRRNLKALWFADRATEEIDGVIDPNLAAYQRGYRAALQAVAYSFGLGELPRQDDNSSLTRY